MVSSLFDSVLPQLLAGMRQRGFGFYSYPLSILLILFAREMFGATHPHDTSVSGRSRQFAERTREDS